MSTGADLLTDKQQQRISTLFVDERHVEVEATWGVYQVMVSAYRDPDRAGGKRKMQRLIDSLVAAVPAALVAVRTLGRTLKKRAADVLAYFDRPGTNNGPTEAIQWPLGTPTRVGPRVPEPRQLRRPIPAGDRRV